MSIPVKFKTAIPNVKWDAPLAAAGNMTADWADSSGAMSRRWAIIEFAKSVNNGDPRLMSELRKELPLLLQKFNRAYREVYSQYGHVQAWVKKPDGKAGCLPQYFHDQAARLKRQLNSLMNFVVMGGMVVRPGEGGNSDGEEEDPEDYYMLWSDFTDDYDKYCRTTSTRKVNLTSEDQYQSTFSELKLRSVTDSRADYSQGGTMRYARWIVGCKSISSMVVQNAMQT